MANPNWTKGVSGNPKGRPRADQTTLDIVKMAKTSGPEIMMRLIDMAMGRIEGIDGSTQVRAANAVLDRGYGKPNQSLDVTTNGETLHNVFVLPQAITEQQDQTIDDWVIRHRPKAPNNLN